MARRKKKTGKLASRPCDACGKQPEDMGIAWAVLYTYPYDLIKDERIICARNNDCANFDFKKKDRSGKIGIALEEWREYNEIRR